MLTKQAFEAKVARCAEFLPGQEVVVVGGSFILGSAPGTVLKFQMGHTHGGSQDNPWWNRHEESCFTKENISYTLVWGYDAKTDTAKLRSDFPASMLRSR